MSVDSQELGVVVDTVSEITCTHCEGKVDVDGLEPFTQIACPHCGKPEKVPARLGAFLLLDLLGHGGMGDVYRAKDQTLGRLVAIKVMQPSLGEDKGFVETFKREAQAAAKLNHPHIAQIYSFGQEKGQPYIVMELVPGRGFDHMIESGKPVDQVTVLRTGRDIADGLRAADEIGLIHGDIKPENILLDDKMNAKLVDFGLATFSHQAAGDSIWGTPYYIAPEKVKRQKVNVRSDIYSLGASLYHALAGRPPFDGETPAEVVKARLDRTPEPLSIARPDVDPQLESIISRMLQPNPAERYPTYKSLISDMQKALDALSPGGATITGKQGKRMVLKKKGGRPGAPTPGAGPPSGSRPAAGAGHARKRGRGAWKVVLWILLILVLAGAGTGGWIYHKTKEERLIARRRATFAMQEQREKADALFGKIQLSAVSIGQAADGTAGLTETVSNTVLAVVGEPLRMPLPEPPAEEEAEAEAAEGEGATPDGETNGPAPKAEAGTESETPANSSPEAEKQPAEKANQPAETPPPADDPEIVVLARKVLVTVAGIHDNVKQAKQIEWDSSNLQEKAATTRRVKEAAEQVKALAEQLTLIETLEQETLQAVESAQRDVEKVEGFKIRMDEEKERKRLAEAEAARKRAEDAAKQREEEARQTLIREEQERAAALRTENAPAVKQHKYQEAAEAAKAELATCETPEGRQAVRVLLDRYTRLQGLKLFVTEQLSAAPFKWGWGRGASATDVLSANSREIQIKGSTVPWERVGTAQMMKFVQHYLGSPAIKPSVAGEQTLATAIFCYEHGGVEAAAKFKQKVLDHFPYLAEEADRLVPTDE